jgi:hypothetical protein
LEVIAKSSDAVIGQRNALDLAKNRESIAGLDRALVSPHRFDSYAGAVGNQFQLRIGGDTERSPQGFRYDDPSYAVNCH